MYSGRIVFSQVMDVREAGEHRIDREGRDQAGRKLSSGVYLLVLESEGRRSADKLTLLQ